MRSDNVSERFFYIMLSKILTHFHIRSYKLNQAHYIFRRFLCVQYPIRNGEIPLHGNSHQQRVDILPALYRQQYVP